MTATPANPSTQGHSAHTLDIPSPNGPNIVTNIEGSNSLAELVVKISEGRLCCDGMHRRSTA